MNKVLLAFHLFMVLFYLGVGGILIFTDLLPIVKNGRLAFGFLFLAYGIYRGYTAWKKFIQDKSEL